MIDIATRPAILLLLLLLGGSGGIVYAWKRLQRENEALRLRNRRLAAELGGEPPPSRPQRRRRSKRSWRVPGRPAWATALLLLLTTASLSLHSERFTGPIASIHELPPILDVPVTSPVTTAGIPLFPQSASSRDCSPISLSYARRLAEWGGRHEKVPPELVLAVIFHESRFAPCAVSVSGALGLMQLLPGTALDMGVGDPFDPAQNVIGGARYLNAMLRRYNGDVALALGAYRIGPRRVTPQTGVPHFLNAREYVSDIMQMADELSAD